MHHSYILGVKNATGNGQTGKVSCCTLMHHSYLLGVKNATGNGQAGKVSCCTLMHQSYLLGCFFYELNNTLR